MQKKSLYVMLTLALSIALYVVFSGFTYHADFKMGYVLSDKIFAQHPPFVDANKKIEAEQQRLEGQLKIMQDELNKKVEEYDSKQLMWSDSKKAEVQNELNELQANLIQFNDENLNPDTGKIRQTWDEIIQPIVENVQNVIDRIGTEEGYDVIFDVKEGLPFILYTKEEYDITDLILEELKKN